MTFVLFVCRIVLMGQGGVGKTAMVLRYTTGDFNEQYMPTIGDMYTKDVEVRGAPRHIEIDDTAGQEAYADLKKEKMSTGDVSVTTHLKSTSDG
jgi:Ras-related protein Rap-2C